MSYEEEAAETMAGERIALRCEACEAEDTEAVTVDGIIRCARCDAPSAGVRTCARCGVTRLAYRDPDASDDEEEDDDECDWCELDYAAFDERARSYRHRYG